MKWHRNTGQAFICQSERYSGERLPTGGVYQWKRKGEFHLLNPNTVHYLQYSTHMNDYASFKKYCKLVNDKIENAATIRWRNLPVVQADQVRMVQLFQNLIGNAIKYRSKDAPCVEITAERCDQQWL
jgi:light-regulated signal transduction histidine kinase (bacteriophytochrome)